MIGRGVLSNPWLIRQCFDHLSGHPSRPVTLQARIDFMLTFLRRVQRETPQPVALGKMKKMGAYLSKGVHGGAHLRTRIHAAGSGDEIIGAISTFSIDFPASLTRFEN